MTPPRPPDVVPPSAPWRNAGNDPIEQLKAQDRNTREFANAAALFLHDIFPARAGVIDNMRDAWIEWQCTGTQEQIKAMEESAKFFKAHPISASLYPDPVSDEERLMELIEDRDRKTTAIDSARRGAAAFPLDGMADMIDASIIAPLERDLALTECQISQLQKSIEQRAHAEPPAVENAEESAKQPTGSDE